LVDREDVDLGHLAFELHRSERLHDDALAQAIARHAVDQERMVRDLGECFAPCARFIVSPMHVYAAG